MEIKLPRKSKGIPKQKNKRSLYDSITQTLSPHYIKFFISKLTESIENSDYWKESLARQMEVLAQLLYDSDNNSDEIINLLKMSKSVYLRGSAAYVVFLAYSDIPEKCCTELKSVGILDGVWPQEYAQVALSKLMSKHGVKVILRFTSDWLYDADERVRRMFVEALRPRGVWVKHLLELKNDPSILESILLTASDDRSLYVRKAAANNLNDICKENPNSVIKWTAKWLKNATHNQIWTIERGLRGLLRENHSDAMALLGYINSSDLKVKWTNGIENIIKINTLIPLEILVSNNDGTDVKVRLQARLSSPGKGIKPRIKNYMISSFELSANEDKKVLKNLHFVNYNSQPRLPGKHILTLFCNGKIIGEKMFWYEG